MHPDAQSRPTSQPQQYAASTAGHSVTSQYPSMSATSRKPDEHAPSLHRVAATANNHPYANYPSSSTNEGSRDATRDVSVPRSRADTYIRNAMQERSPSAGSQAADVRPRSFSSGAASDAQSAAYNWKRKRHLETVRTARLWSLPEVQIDMRIHSKGFSRRRRTCTCWF